MPVQVYVLGESRAIPVNFFEAILDETLVDWASCQGNQDCYLADLRTRFNTAVAGVDNHAFVTEYAGDASIMNAKVALLNADVTELSAQTSALSFLLTMHRQDIPAIDLVHTIVEQWLGTTYTSAAPSMCSAQTNVYVRDETTLNSCIPFLSSSSSFDADAMAAELNSKVIVPAAAAQTFVDSYAKLTRMYTQLSETQMTKDPFFSFNPDLEEVSRIHSATAVPVCSSTATTGMKAPPNPKP